MGNMKRNQNFKTILLLGVLLLQLLALKPGLNCYDFSSDFHFSAFDLKLQIEEAIHNDIGISLFWVRFFHNKLTFFVLDVFRRFLMFWDFQFLLSFLLPIGILGFLVGIYYSLVNNNRKKKRGLLFVLCYLLFISLFEIIFSPKLKFLIKLLFLIIPSQFFSLFGLLKFLQKNKRNVFMVIILLLISIWWTLVFPSEFGRFCVK